MKERPILFSGEMVRMVMTCARCGAISATFPCACGSVDFVKTVTRRVVNRLAGFGPITEFQASTTKGYAFEFRNKRGLWNSVSRDRVMGACPYGQPGDRLWVRENFQPYFAEDPYDMSDADPLPDYKTGRGYLINYVADGKIMELYDEDGKGLNSDVTPSIHMPRWASRITLEVTGVRVERVQDITEEGAKAEGVEAHPPSAVDGRIYRRPFNILWDSINKDRGFGWDKNPWVWVVEFRRVNP